MSSRSPRGTATFTTLVVLLLLLGLTAGLLSLLRPARARAAAAVEAYAVPGSRTFQLSGLGFGHGIGMSQFGAEGMGRLGKSYREILKFYYPGTRFAEVAPSRQITVGLSGLTRSTPQGSAVVVRQRRGLVASNGDHELALPRSVDGEAVNSFRMVRHDNGLAVWAVSSAGAQKVKGGLGGAVHWQTSASSGASRFTVQSAAGGYRTYRGSLAVTSGPSSMLAVNRLLLEDYLRSVVSSEVPSSWTDAALRAQAVAARSYALLAQQNARAAHRPYDICDSTYCQMYSPVSAESDAEVQAVQATAGSYLQSAGQPAFAMFSSANGGYSVAGGRPYLVAQPDPYDGVVTGSANWGHHWDATVGAAAIERAWPQVGRLQAIKVLARDGNGSWGGRVMSVGLVGSDSTVSVSADSFRWATGLKSTWWTVTNVDGSTAAPVANVRVSRGDRAATVRWRPPHTERAVRAYQVTVSGTDDTYRVDPAEHRVRLRGLTNGKRYRARVAAIYRSGPGPKTASPAFVPTSSYSYFRALSPTRVVDQRRTPSAARAGTLAVPVTGAGLAPAPGGSTGTRAVTVRVMATSGAHPGRVHVFPCDARDRAQLAVVYPADDTTVGLATVPARSGEICLAASTPLAALRVDLLGYYTASGVDSTSLRVVAPRPVVDSRAGLGWSSGRLATGEPRSVPVAGREGIPQGVRTVVVNLGLVRPSEPATLSVAPPGTSPTLGAAVRAPQRQWRTGTVVAHLDADGRLPLRLTAGRAHVQVDVLGWFRPQRGEAAGRFRAVPGLQVLDPASSGALTAGDPRRVRVRGGDTGIPDSAASVLVQALARPGGDASGFLTVLPSGSQSAPRPLLAFGRHGAARTLMVVPVGDDGRITVTAEDADADASLRVVGWYS